jgi:DNA-binding response OmpR family regulator
MFDAIHKKPRVLFVTDFCENPCTMEQGFLEGGFEFALARNHTEFIVPVLDGLPDAVVLDVCPQSLDTMLESLRTSGADACTRVIVAGTQKPLNCETMAHTLGVDRYISRPFTFDDVQRAVCGALSARACGSHRARYSGRILLADHGRISSMLAETVLAELGFTVVVTRRTEQTLSEALSSQFDMILVRDDLPDMNCVSFMRHLRQHGIHSHVLALVANLHDEDEMAYLASGLSGCLAIPVSRSQIQMKMGGFFRTATAAGAEAYCWQL